MDKKLRIAGALLAALAGVLHIYNALADRPAGADFPFGDVSTGVLWMAFGILVYNIRSEKR